MVQLSLSNIQNPNSDDNCQLFDPSQLSAIVNALDEDQRMIVTGVTGSNLCDLTPCSPSPCRNNGDCSLNENLAAGYVCACPLGYTGVDCTEDTNECAQGKAMSYHSST